MPTEVYEFKLIPEYEEPLGHAIPGPLRLMTSEWVELCFTYQAWYVHHKFTLEASMEPCATRNLYDRLSDGTVVDLGAMFDLCIILAFPRSHPKGAVFGPYERGDNTAIGRAGAYLIKHGILVLLDMPEDARPYNWIMQAYKDQSKKKG